MKIRITMEVDDSYADPDDGTGLTEEGFTKLTTTLMSFGYDAEIEKVEDGS